MMNGILSPVFLQSAGRAGKGGHVGKITLFTQRANPSIDSISCTGEIKVSSIYNGEKKVETYTDLSGETLSIQADANTQIVISGVNITDLRLDNSDGTGVEYTKISVKNTALQTLVCNNCYSLTAIYLSENTALTELECSDCFSLTTLDLSENTALTKLSCGSCHSLTTLDLSKNTALTELECSDCYALTALDLSKNTALTKLHCSSSYMMTTLDVSKNTALTKLHCSYCYELTALNLSKNTALTELECYSIKKIVSISYPATNSNVSTKIATAITNADSTTGTVYTDSAAAYYSTIATAATTKGWTIAQIPA